MADDRPRATSSRSTTVDIRGVPTKVFRNAPPSLRAVWDLSARFAGDTTTSSTSDERITFADAHREVRARRPVAARARRASRATASPSRRATCPSGSSPSGRRRRSARSPCRSTRGGPGPSSPTASPTRAPSCCSPTTSAPSASRRTSAKRACGHGARAHRARAPRRCAVVGGRRGRRPAAARRRRRSRRRRHDHVHVRHDRQAEGCGRRPTATSATS